MSSIEDRVYTPSEAARRLGLTPARVRQFMADGRLPHRRTPLGRLLDADAVDAMVVARSGRRHVLGEVAP
jgi:excisionase family DNA binding protein